MSRCRLHACCTQQPRGAPLRRLAPPSCTAAGVGHRPQQPCLVCHFCSDTLFATSSQHRNLPQPTARAAKRRPWAACAQAGGLTSFTAGPVHSGALVQQGPARQHAKNLDSFQTGTTGVLSFRPVVSPTADRCLPLLWFAVGTQQQGGGWYQEGGEEQQGRSIAARTGRTMRD